MKLTNDLSRDRQLLLLGACMADQKILAHMSPSDFLDADIAGAIQEMQDAVAGDKAAKACIRLKALSERLGVLVQAGSSTLQAIASFVKSEGKEHRVRLQLGKLRFGAFANGMNRDGWLQQVKMVAQELEN